MIILSSIIHLSSRHNRSILTTYQSPRFLFCSHRITLTIFLLNSSGHSIKIEEFDQNVLKNGVDQEITEEWSIGEAIVAGDINSLINGLDMVVDVVRYSNVINNITAVKSFDGVAVRNINCKNGCTLIGVDIGDWISKLAFAGGNYTIQGTTVIEAPIFYNNIK